MTKIDNEMLKRNYQEIQANLASDESAGIVYPYVSARIVKNVSVASSFEQYGQQYEFRGDEAQARGGLESGPSPMRYFLSGIAFCLLGWYAKGAAVNEVEVTDMTLDIRTLLNMRGEHGASNIPANPQWMILEIRVKSPCSSTNVLTMIDWGNARCPLGVLVSKAIPVYQSVFHNGQRILDTIPDAMRSLR